MLPSPSMLATCPSMSKVPSYEAQSLAAVTLPDPPSSQHQANPPQANKSPCKKLPKSTPQAPQAPQANENSFPKQMCRKINPQANFTLIPKQVNSWFVPKQIPSKPQANFSIKSSNNSPRKNTTQIPIGIGLGTRRSTLSEIRQI